mmetsp:Transcript_3708/g.15412  ORF Transcript_3708/g.15412 Transcript_3708/m.15412 type:complete len:830 (+) Transcript_3708:1826-4315(+)
MVASAGESATASPDDVTADHDTGKSPPPGPSAADVAATAWSTTPSKASAEGCHAAVALAPASSVPAATARSRTDGAAGHAVRTSTVRPATEQPSLTATRTPRRASVRGNSVALDGAATPPATDSETAPGDVGDAKSDAFAPAEVFPPGTITAPSASVATASPSRDQVDVSVSLSLSDSAATSGTAPKPLATPFQRATTGLAGRATLGAALQTADTLTKALVKEHPSDTSASSTYSPRTRGSSVSDRPTTSPAGVATSDAAPPSGDVAGAAAKSDASSAGSVWPVPAEPIRALTFASDVTDPISRPGSSDSAPAGIHADVPFATVTGENAASRQRTTSEPAVASASADHPASTTTGAKPRACSGDAPSYGEGYGPPPCPAEPMASAKAVPLASRAVTLGRPLPQATATLDACEKFPRIPLSAMTAARAAATGGALQTAATIADVVLRRQPSDTVTSTSHLPSRSGTASTTPEVGGRAAEPFAGEDAALASASLSMALPAAAAVAGSAAMAPATDRSNETVPGEPSQRGARAASKAAPAAGSSALLFPGAAPAAAPAAAVEKAATGAKADTFHAKVSGPPLALVERESASSCTEEKFPGADDDANTDAFRGAALGAPAVPGSGDVGGEVVAPPAPTCPAAAPRKLASGGAPHTARTETFCWTTVQPSEADSVTVQDPRRVGARATSAPPDRTMMAAGSGPSTDGSVMGSGEAGATWPGATKLAPYVSASPSASEARPEALTVRKAVPFQRDTSTGTSPGAEPSSSDWTVTRGGALQVALTTTSSLDTTQAPGTENRNRYVPRLPGTKEGARRFCDAGRSAALVTLPSTAAA